MKQEKTSFLQRPSVQYCVLMLLGSFGVYIAMPIDLNPQSRIEQIDLAINLIIFVPCFLITVGSGILMVLSAVLSRQIDKKERFKRFAHLVLKAFGLHKLLSPGAIILSPSDFLRDLVGGSGKPEEPSEKDAGNKNS